MLSAFGDFVRRERPDPAGVKLRECSPRLPHRFPGGLRGLSRGWTPAAGRVDLRQHLGNVTLYTAKLPGLAQRIPETAGLVHQPELQRLRTCPHPSADDAF